MTVARSLSERIADLDEARFPSAVREACERLLVDGIGLCVAARDTPYVRAALSAWSDPGDATAIGHPRTASAAAAAFVNGTAIHGEDFDDTFEGGPVHAGAVIVPAVLAVAESQRLDGASALRGIAAGVETICRLSVVVPKAVHRAGFHPTAVFGALAAAAGTAAALRLDPARIANALGVAGSMAGGIIEYLADGSWTKRMHPGWAAQSGLRAALLAREGFVGPASVFEGTHGLFNAFAHTREGNYAALLDGFGDRWTVPTLAFKPYPCGTMIQPYVDCALRLVRKGIRVAGATEIVCEVAEGTVHRLWEPLAQKQRPPNGYAAKFSGPWCVAAALARGSIGPETFTDLAVQDAAVRAIAAKVRFEIDPANPYPNEYTGCVRVRLAGGGEAEERQPHLRGGAREPLAREEIDDKLRANARAGGWTDERIGAALALSRRLWDGAVDLGPLRG